MFKLLLKCGDRAVLEQRLGEMAEEINRFNDKLQEKYLLTMAEESASWTIHSWTS